MTRALAWWSLGLCLVLAGCSTQVADDGTRLDLSRGPATVLEVSVTSYLDHATRVTIDYYNGNLSKAASSGMDIPISSASYPRTVTDAQTIPGIGTIRVHLTDDAEGFVADLTTTAQRCNVGADTFADRLATGIGGPATGPTGCLRVGSTIGG